MPRLSKRATEKGGTALREIRFSFPNKSRGKINKILILVLNAIRKRELEELFVAEALPDNFYYFSVF